MVIASNPKIAGGDKTPGQVVACREVTACRHRAYVGILAVFLLAFCLLGVDDAIAQDHLELNMSDFPDRPNDYTTRLIMFDADYGESGEWRWICDDNFGEEETRVACRQLGLPTGGAGVWEMPACRLTVPYCLTALCDPRDYQKEVFIMNLSSIPAFLDDVDCDGDEFKLTDCDHARLGVNDCVVSEAVGVTCPAE